MAGINCVFLLGRLPRDPEVRPSPEGTEARFLLGIEYRARDVTGAWLTTPCVVEVVATGRQADLAGAHLRTGRAVFVEGRLDANGAEAPDRLRVLAQRLTFLPRVLGAQPREDGAVTVAPAWIDQEG
jgi:single-stranded DNA-binding protein